MKYPPTLETAPTEEFISLIEAKTHLRIDHDDDNAMLAGLITAAISHLDGYSGVIGRCLVSQTWNQPVQLWGAKIALPFPSCASVVITYEDVNASSQTLDAAKYEVIEGAISTYIAWRDAFDDPSTNTDKETPINVQFVSGYGDETTIPKPIWVAALMMIAHWYEVRECSSEQTYEVPFGVKAMLGPYTRMPV